MIVEKTTKTQIQRAFSLLNIEKES